MQSQTANIMDHMEKNRAPRGRKDKQGQEKVIDLTVLAQAKDELVNLHQKNKLAASDLESAVTRVSEKAGLQSSVVRKWLTAVASDKAEEKARDARQLALLFDEMK